MTIEERIKQRVVELESLLKQRHDDLNRLQITLADLGTEKEILERLLPAQAEEVVIEHGDQATVTKVAGRKPATKTMRGTILEVLSTFGGNSSMEVHDLTREVCKRMPKCSRYSVPGQLHEMKIKEEIVNEPRGYYSLAK